MDFAEYLEEHAEVVPYMQTRLLLRCAADALRKKSPSNYNDFYIKALPNGDFVVICDED